MPLKLLHFPLLVSVTLVLVEGSSDFSSLFQLTGAQLTFIAPSNTVDPAERRLVDRGNGVPQQCLDDIQAYDKFNPWWVDNWEEQYGEYYDDANPDGVCTISFSTSHLHNICDHTISNLMTERNCEDAGGVLYTMAASTYCDGLKEKGPRDNFYDLQDNVKMCLAKSCDIQDIMDSISREGDDEFTAVGLQDFCVATVAEKKNYRDPTKLLKRSKKMKKEKVNFCKGQKRSKTPKDYKNSKGPKSDKVKKGKYEKSYKEDKHDKYYKEEKYEKSYKSNCVTAEDGIINGSYCPHVSYVMRNCLPGEDPEGKICANKGTDTPAYCSYDIDAGNVTESRDGACAYCVDY